MCFPALQALAEQRASSAQQSAARHGAACRACLRLLLRLLGFRSELRLADVGAARLAASGGLTSAI